MGLDFSPDGQWVAYTDPIDGTLWRSGVDGSRRQQLTSAAMFSLKPRWSPDGKRIAFAGYAGANPGQVFVMPAEGGSPERLTSGNASVGFVSWSKDGASLLVGEWNQSTQADDADKIHSYLLDLKTGQRTPLAGSEGMYGPAWSPDGRYIAAKSQTEVLQLFDVASKRWRDLGVGPVQWVTWSRDSRHLYFGSVVKQEPVLQRVKAPEGTMERVASLYGLNRLNYGHSPSWIGLAPDESPLLLRDVSTQDIFALDVDLP
jgi:Tol biopolymer transport system component